ncbi:MAG TPA: sigma-70 family RNA polymerase sigma factor [Patescibacteria group bacterium]|nr:sigma-70 family RNA polymerase sigma factor [Patescibacteria group bacterium]
MNSRTDQDLLREYAGDGSEVAFSELVRRYTDFVYSIAVRLLGDAHLAQDISQRVFLAVAQNAQKLAERSVLAGWLHCTTHHLCANALRCGARRHAREQKAADMNDSLSPDPQPAWESVAPYLDAALSQLSAPDRNAVLLRYFQQKSAREMAQIMSISSQAAQKRVNRAVERLRTLFAKRGINVSSNDFALLITANAVQPAPVALSVTISAAAVAATSFTTSTTIATAKLIAMTTTQKALLAATLAAIVGSGIYQIREINNLRQEVQAVQLQRSSIPGTPSPLSPAALVDTTDSTLPRRQSATAAVCHCARASHLSKEG